MDEKELQNKDQEPAAAAAEEAGGEAEAAPAEAQEMQPMPDEGENEPEQAAAAEEAGGEEQAEAVAEEAVQQGQAEGASEDPKEEQEEKEEQKEQEENPQEAGSQEQGEELAGDDINMDMAAVAAEAGVENEDDEDKGDPDRAFDTLDDLKKLSGESDSADGESDDNDTSERAIQDRKAVMQLRKGNLYKAVIFAKMLESGQNPAGEEKELEARQQAAPQGRFARFLNASKLDKAGKVLKLANAASGLAGMADSGYKGSRLSGLISKASDVLTLVNSIRGIIKKLRDFKKNSTSPTKKAFAVIGLISEFGVAISKGAAIAQKLFTRRGWGGLAKIMGHLSSFAGTVGQIAALTNVSNTLKELVEGTAPIKKAQKEEEANVLAVLGKYEIEGGTAGAAEQGKTEKGKGQKGAKRRRLGKNNALKEKVLNALERPDISEEDKAVLASYLGRGRILSKRKLAIANVATGLVSAALGLGATFSKNAASHSEGNTQAMAIKHATGFGALANINMLGSAVGMHIAEKKVNSGHEKENNLIKEGLFGALHDLSDDKYGLRKIAATLAPKEPDKGDMQEAENAVKKYETATKQFQGSGVNYAKLFTATNTEAFKNSLVASL